MGQKVNPIGLRLGVVKNWESIWYADKKNYKKALLEDIKIREFILKYPFGTDKSKNKKVTPEIAKIEILRKPDRILIIIHSSRPGVVIGVDGKNIMDISKEIGKIVSLKIEIKIKEIKQPEKDAQLIANTIARQLKNRVPFRRAMKRAITDAKKAGIGGIKIQCSGRLGGADMARTEWYREGRIPLHTLRADIDYGVATAFTTYGTTGVKVWVFKREVLKRELKTDAGQLVKKQKKPAKDKEKNKKTGE